MNVGDLLPLLVMVPLLGALLPFLLGARRPALARLATALVLLVQVGLAVAVVWLVATGGRVTYVVGGLPAAFGIGLLVDAVAAAFLLLVAVAGAGLYLAVREDATGPADALWLLLVAGLTGVAVTADAFNLYVFLEISGLAAYALIATRRGGDAALAALHYLLVGTVGATCYLLGVGYLYVATGTLAMADLRVALPAAGYDSPLVLAAFALVVVGLGVKLALFPLHAWKPAAYGTAAPDVAALLATLGSTVAGYALIRLTFDVFTAEFLAAVPLLRDGLLLAGAVGVLAGGYLTLRRSNLRRLLAYSSVVQFGLVLVGIALATPLAVTGALVLLFANAVAKGGLFVASGLFERRGAGTVDALAGEGEEQPGLTLAVAVLFASLVGLPPTAGFAGKWYVALAAVDAGQWVAAAVVLASTLLSLAYAGRVVERLFLAPGASVAATADGSPSPADGLHPDGGVTVPTAETAPALTLVVLAALAVVALGLGSTALADWFAPVVEGWL